MVCDPDTVNYGNGYSKLGPVEQYKAFRCVQVTKLGIRVDVGFNHYVYSSKTRDWLGNHNGPLLGISIAYTNFSIGFKFKPATVTPQTELAFNEVLLTSEAKLNPNKMDYELAYSINLRQNISIEPFIGLSANRFVVINEKDLKKHYEIKNAKGSITGVTLNKYFSLKGVQFFSVFARYGYGFVNFKSSHEQLGNGYSDLSLGIAYKAFGKKQFLKRIVE
ncbi:hypothetical protein GCM10027516_06690 [Niabella aquatica]